MCEREGYDKHKQGTLVKIFMQYVKYLFHGNKLVPVSVEKMTELTASLFSQKCLKCDSNDDVSLISPDTIMSVM